MSLVCLRGPVVDGATRRRRRWQGQKRRRATRHSKKPSLTFFFGATASPPATAEKPASAAGRFRARGAERGGGSYLARSLRFVATPVARTNARGARASCFGCRRL